MKPQIEPISETTTGSDVKRTSVYMCLLLSLVHEHKSQLY